MANLDSSYSNLVAWLKIILPLIALGILSTLFLVSKALDPSHSIPFADVDLQALAQDPRIGRPTFSGVTTDGTAITISAGTARPGLNGHAGLAAQELRAFMTTAQGTTLEFKAPQGQIDAVAKTAQLSGGVALQISGGYSIQTGQIIADLATTRISTSGNITATGPFGTISAGRMLLVQKTADDAPATYELVFNDGVNLIYTPQQ